MAKQIALGIAPLHNICIYVMLMWYNNNLSDVKMRHSLSYKSAFV